MSAANPNIQKRSIAERVGLAAAILATASGAVACSNVVEGMPALAPVTAHKPVPPPEFVQLVPDFSRLRKDGNCEGGDPRPCFLPLRKNTDITQPATQDTIVNLINGTNEVQWPYEASPPTKGDAVDVVCQVIGKTTVSNAYGDKDNRWDIIKVPTIGMSAQAIYDAGDQSDPATYGVLKDGPNVVDVYAFAPALWLPDPSNQIAQLAPCTSAENPVGYAMAPR